MEINSAMKKILLVVFLFDTVFAEKYIITRRSRNARGDIQPDLVQIPPPLCKNNGTTECPLMDAQKDSAKMCQCVCNQKDGFHRLYKTTFQFHNETWKCAKNAELHKLSGCSFSYDGMDENVLVTLPSDATVRHSLSNIATPGQYIQLPEGTTCAIRAQNSTSLKCNGEWEQLNSSIVAKRFHISYGTPSDGKYFARVWVNATERIAYPLPSGRIITLGITCSDRPWEPSQCIVAKIEGQFQCPVSIFPVPSTTTPHPSITASSVLTSATPSPSTTKPSVSSSTPPVPPEISSSVGQTPSTLPSSTPFPTSPSSSKPSTTTVEGGVDPEKIFSSTLIGLLLGGIAALLALVIIIVIIAKRRRKRCDDKTRKNSRAAMVVENESFEQGDDLEDGSNHHYANINPIVATSTASALNNNGKGGHRNSVANKVYEVVEELDKPNQESNPKTANTSEGQDPTNKTRNEPLPSIPESNFFITYKDPHDYENVDNNNLGPQYASLYDVIDGPQTNDSLEGKINRAHDTSSNMPESGHGPNPFYDTVGGVIED